MNEANTLSFAQDTFSVFYQDKEYYTGNKVKVLKPKFKGFNQKIGNFIVSIFDNILKHHTWGTGSTVESINSLLLNLPIKNKKIDFEFMESFVAELEAQRVAELEAYLTVTGLKDCELTEHERKALEDFNSDKTEWKVYMIKDLFDVKSYKKRFDANKVKLIDSGYPYVVRMSTNNGIKGYLKEDEKYLNKGNTISFGQDTATIFYQQQPYFTGDKIKILESKYSEFSKQNAHFIIATMAKAFKLFSWGYSSFSVKIIEEQLIHLPVRSGEIDFELMSVLIKIVEKLVIKDVVLWTDKKIEAAKEVIAN